MAKQEEIILPPITFMANGPTEEIRQANLDAVLPSYGYPDACFLFAEAIVKNVEIILLDYRKDGCAVKFQIDGVWHELPPRPRDRAELMLATLKKLANLNYMERRARQEGEFGAKFMNKTIRFVFISQGVATGERVVIRLDYQKKKITDLEALGMRPKMKEAFVSCLKQTKSLTLLSALPQDGVTTFWQASLNACDRFTRDFIAIEAKESPETDVINVEPVRFSTAAGEGPMTKLPQVLLRQPDVLCIPNFVNGEFVNAMTEFVNEDEKQVVGFTHARNAVESILRVLVLKPKIKEFAQALTCVLHQRIVRKLCDRCKQPYAPANDLLVKLGIRPGRVQAFYDEWRMPPPEMRVDEKGNPIEIPLCPQCHGLGYWGRTAIYELLIINDQIRQALVDNPTLEAVSKAAASSGHISLRDEGIVLVAKGVTSVQELQRVLSK